MACSMIIFLPLYINFYELICFRIYPYFLSYVKLFFSNISSTASFIYSVSNEMKALPQNWIVFPSSYIFSMFYSYFLFSSSLLSMAWISSPSFMPKVPYLCCFFINTFFCLISITAYFFILSKSLRSKQRFTFVTFKDTYYF